MILLFLVSCAGAFGALARFGVTTVGNRIFYDTYFPLPTLLINLLAAVLLGIGAGALPATSLGFLLTSGFLGGFSTYSTFTNEFTTLLHDYPKVAYSYILLSVGLGIAGAGLGFWLGAR